MVQDKPGTQIMIMTWNMARKPHYVDFDILFPDVK